MLTQLIRSKRLRVTAVVVIGMALIASAITFSLAPKVARAQGAVDFPVLLLHGFDDTCDRFGAGEQSSPKAQPGELMNYLMQQGWASYNLRPIGYYLDSAHSGEGDCYDNVYTTTDGTLLDENAHCAGFINDPNFTIRGTLNDPLTHVSCALAWYIYDVYTKQGVPVNVVAHSMGGLLIRYALGESGVEVCTSNNTTQCFPPGLDVEDVVTLGTPHGGISNEFASYEADQYGSDVQFTDMLVKGNTPYPTATSQFMQVIAQIQNPQGIHGTCWTLIASGIPSGFGQLGPGSNTGGLPNPPYNDAIFSYFEETNSADAYPDGDGVVQASSALDMYAENRILYGAEQYAGVDYIADAATMYRHGVGCVQTQGITICAGSPTYLSDSDTTDTTYAWLCQNCGPTMDSLNVYNTSAQVATRIMPTIFTGLECNDNYPTATPIPTSTSIPPTATATPIPVTHYDYSSVFWGTNTGSYTDLSEAAYDSRNPGWGRVDVSSQLRGKGQDIPSLTQNKGSPAVVSYVDSSGATRLDVFALGDNGAIGHYDYDASSGAWAYAGIGASVGLPVLQPSALALSPAVMVYGITSSGHLVEYFTNSAPYGTWQGSDVTQQSGFSQTCDSRIRPAVTSFNGTVEVFADCGGKLTQFFYSGGWHANQSIGGALSIPNVSVSFPGHSIAAVVTPGSNPAMEVYVASDANGVNALSEALYTSSGGWTQYRLPATSFAPDQVYASSQPVASSGGAAMSEVIVTGAPPASCADAGPPTEQYVYQASTGKWNTNPVSVSEVTSVQSIVEVGDNNAVLTEAATGAYTATGGCTGAAAVEYASNTLSSGNVQSWTSGQTISTSSLSDNAGLPPGGNIFDYALIG